MQRRRYLALLTLSLAGCTGGDEGTSTPTGTPSATPTRDSTPTDTPTGTETPTDTPTETEEPTDTPEPTPSSEEIAAEHLDRAEEYLQDAIDAFVAPAGSINVSLLDIDGSVEPAQSEVAGALVDMSGELDAAAEHATEDQQATIEDYRHLYTFMERLLDGQPRAHRLWTTTRDATELAIGEQFDDVDGKRRRIDHRRELVADVLTTLQTDADSSATQVSSAISGDVYVRKIEQLAAEHATAGSVYDALSDVTEGLREFVAASDDYRAGNYSNAEVKFWSAYQATGPARDTLPDDRADAYARLVDDLECVVAAVDVAARELEQSAQNGSEQVREEAARDVLQGCGRIDDAPTISEFRDWLDERV